MPGRAPDNAPCAVGRRPIQLQPGRWPQPGRPSRHRGAVAAAQRPWGSGN